METAGFWITVICDNCGPNTLFSVSAALVGKINYQCWMLSETFVWRHLLSTEYKCAGPEPSCRAALDWDTGTQKYIWKLPEQVTITITSPTPPGGCSRALQHCSVNTVYREDLSCSRQQPALEERPFTVVIGSLRDSLVRIPNPLSLYTINAQCSRTFGIHWHFRKHPRDG